jgi:predicted nucleotidyltransferase
MLPERPARAVGEILEALGGPACGGGAQEAEVHDNLDAYLNKLTRLLRRLDPEARAYLVGSVARGESTYSSDVDVLIVTGMDPGAVIAALRSADIPDVIELHVVEPDREAAYLGRGPL